MTKVEFEGEVYRDDRMFVIHLCKAVVSDIDEDTFQTTVYHEQDPEEFVWCLITYRNTDRYPVYRVDHFDSIESARAYLEYFEPRVPLISLGGKSPETPMPYSRFAEWKRVNRLEEYDYRTVFRPGGRNPRESVISRKRK